MAHTFLSATARASSAASPITFSQTVNGGATVMVLLLKVNGATNRAGGAPTWGGFTLTQANTTQKAAASPEASCELWYLVDPPNGTNTLTIPNTGSLTIFYEVATGKAGAGKTSAIDQTNGANGTSTNPAPGSVTTTVNGDIGFAVVATGAQTWAPSAQVGTVITNVDDGAHGGGTQYHLQATAGAVNLGWTFGTSEDWGAVVAYFKEVDAPAITIDRWRTSAQIPPLKAKTLATALIPTLFFVPVVAAGEAPPTPVYVGGQNCEPIKIEHFQYQSVAFVPIVQAAAPEVPHTYLQQTQQPIFKQKRLIQYGVNVAIGSERIYLDVLAPPISQPIFPVKRRWSEIVGSPSPVAAAPPETLTLDKWGRPTEQPQRRITRQQYESVRPLALITPETITSDKWAQQTQVPLFRQRQVITETVKPLVPIVPSETVTSDKWTVAAELPRQRLLRRQDTNGNLVFVVLQQTPEVFERQSEPQRPKRGQIQVGVEPPIQEQVAIPESWRVENQSPITRSIRRVFESAQPLLTSFAETVSLDRFYLNQNEPRRDVKRWQHLYPSFVADTLLHGTPSVQLPGTATSSDARLMSATTTDIALNTVTSTDARLGSATSSDRLAGS